MVTNKIAKIIAVGTDPLAMALGYTNKAVGLVRSLGERVIQERDETFILVEPPADEEFKQLEDAAAHLLSSVFKMKNLMTEYRMIENIHRIRIRRYGNIGPRVTKNPQRRRIGKS